MPMGESSAWTFLHSQERGNNDGVGGGEGRFLLYYVPHAREYEWLTGRENVVYGKPMARIKKVKHC
jgi:hypothetical protein